MGVRKGMRIRERRGGKEKQEKGFIAEKMARKNGK